MAAPAAAAAAIAASIIPAFGRWSTPIGRSVAQFANEQLPNELPTPNQLIDMFAQGILGPNSYKSLMSLNGAQVLSGRNYLYRYSNNAGLIVAEVPPIVTHSTSWDLLAASTEWVPDWVTTLTLWQQGRLSNDAANKWLSRLGMRDESLQQSMLATRTYIPPVQDLIRFAVREAFNVPIRQALGLDLEIDQNPEFLFWAARQGLGVTTVNNGAGGTASRNFAADYWAAHWQHPSPTQAYQMLHRLRPDAIGRLQAIVPGVTKFDINDLRTLLKINDYAPAWRDKLAAISYRVPRLVDIRRMLRIGVIGRDATIGYLRDYGYDPTSAEQLAQFMVQDIPWKPSVSQVIRWRNAGVIGDQEAQRHFRLRGVEGPEQNALIAFGQWQPTLAVAQRWFRFNLIGEPRFREILTHYGVPAHDQQNYVNESRAKPANKQILLSISNIKEAYQIGYIDRATAEAKLLQLGLSNNDAAVALQSIDLRINVDFLKKSIAGIRKRFLRGELDRLAAGGQLTQLAVEATRIQQYLRLWEIELTTTHRTLSAQRVIDMLKRGLIDVAEASRRLTNLGYPRSDQELLLLAAAQDVQQAVAKAALQAARTAAQQEQAAIAALRQQDSERRKLVADLARHGSPSQLKTWIGRGLMDRPTALARLSALGWPLGDADLLVKEGEILYAERQARLAAQSQAPAPQAEEATDAGA